MARERWFFAQGSGRRGPVPLAQLVESLLGQPDPRAVLVWRKGFAAWTRAEDVPEVERGLAAPAAVHVEPAPAVAVPNAASAAGRHALAYAGIVGAAAVLGVVGWLFWPHRPVLTPVRLGVASTNDAPATVIAKTAPAARPSAEPPPAVEPPSARARAVSKAAVPAPAAAAGTSPGALAERVSEIPASERRKLRGVAAWSADRLELTVYNGSGWRVTELRVKIFRFTGEEFVEDAQLVTLLPPGAPVHPGVVDLMNQVAPDRRKAGLDPLDTGPFEGQAGPPPESFRFEIESARGYPPRR